MRYFLLGACAFFCILQMPLKAYHEPFEVECEAHTPSKLSKKACRFSVADAEPFFLEESHPIKSRLDALFAKYYPLESAAAIEKAGFKLVSERPSSMRVLAHPQLLGYLLKLYPLNERDNKQRNICWAIKRCFGAQYIRELIVKKKLQHFSVPMKWIYLLPNAQELQAAGIQNYAVLVVEDMQLVPKEESRWVWANLKSKNTIDELYAILSQGLGSSRLPVNIPYTKSGKFACIDTEYAQSRLSYQHVSKHISPSMQSYWNKLIKQGGNTVGFKID